MASAATSSSKAPGLRHFPAVATAAPRSARCCANTSSARRWLSSAPPTTRSLAAVMTGESVFRETALPGAVLTRVASSHIRVGTFQFFAARGDTEGVRRLADHVIARHYPQAACAQRPYHALLEGVIARQAELVARWLLVGFIDGVMNTDNTSISGETIDHGPCAFMDHYDPQKCSPRSTRWAATPMPTSRGLRCGT